MTTILNPYPRFLDDATLDRMHGAALTMLSRTGVRVEHDEVRAEIARRDGFTLRDGRVHIAPAAVERWVETRRAGWTGVPQPVPARGYQMLFDDRPAWVVDRDGVTVRPMTRADVIDSAKLIRALDAPARTGGVPTDVPPPLLPLEQYLIAAEYSSQGGGTSWVCDIPTAEAVREMDRVYGRPYVQSVYSPSPLVFGGPELDILWHFRSEATLVLAGSMPIMGLTGPVDTIGVFTVGVAECLGGAAILQELFPGIPVMFMPHPEPANLRNGAIVFGSPEWQILDVMHRDVFVYYGIDRNDKLTLTTASLPDAQAQAEHATSAVLGVMNGFMNYGPIGQLALDETWSPAQCMLDVEMLDEAVRIARGPESAPGLELDRLADVVDEVVRERGLFAEHESTLFNMRGQYHDPRVFQRLTRPQWIAAGRPDPVREAHARADELVAAYDYPAPPEDILRELRRIYERAKGKLL